MRSRRVLTTAIRLATALACIALAPGVVESTSESFLTTRALDVPAPTARPEVPPLARDATLDLLHLYRDLVLPQDDSKLLASRLDQAHVELQQVRLRDNRNRDLLLEAPDDTNAALLLRLRVLEDMALRLERYATGLVYAQEAESLETGLRLRLDRLRPGSTSPLALASGLRLGRRESERLLAALYEQWRRRWFSPPNTHDTVLDFWIFHRLAAVDARVLEDVRARPARNPWEQTLAELATRAVSGSLELFATERPERRLLLAVFALCEDGVLPTRARELARFAAQPDFDSPEVYTQKLDALDSLHVLLEDGRTRSTQIHGSRRNYYKPQGQAAPRLHPEEIRQARRTGLAAIDQLRARFGNTLLLRIGMRAHAELDPVEIVPGQQVAAVWSLHSTRTLEITNWTAHLVSQNVPLRSPPGVIPAQGTLTLRTAYAPLPRLAAGATLAPWLQLGFTLEGWGPVRLEDRVPVRIVAPVQAALEPQGGRLVPGLRKSVDLFVTSRAPSPIQGTLRVLSTSDWKVEPSRVFQFHMRRPGQSVRQRLELVLPSFSSPGPYELAVRLEAGGWAWGTLRAQLVKPIEWLVTGPFPRPPGDRLLQPEKGVDVRSIYTGLGDTHVVWQIAPVPAYNADGALDLEALFPEVRAPACACVFSILESTDAGFATLRVEGVSRTLWNGIAPGPEGRVRVERGRNTILLRACSGPEGWRLWAGLDDMRGEPLRSIVNDMPRLLEGYASLGHAAARVRALETADRLVTVRFLAPSAEGVSVLGTFNAWVPLDLEKQADGTWVRELRLTPGRYAYKLMVDGRLRPDPGAPASEPDGFGGHNSLLIVR